MASCTTCEHPSRREIERQAKAGVPATTLSAWTRTTDGGYVSRLAIGNHLRKHVGVSSPKGRRPYSGDLAADVVARVGQRLEANEIEPGISDGLKAAAILDARKQADAEKDWQAFITLALTGGSRRSYLPDPDTEAIEAEIRELTAGESSGATPIPVDIRVKPVY